MDIAYVSFLLASLPPSSFLAEQVEKFREFLFVLLLCVFVARTFYHKSSENPVFSIKWLQLQRHRRETLQDVFLMTFVIWNSCVLFARGRNQPEFSLCACWRVCILQILDCCSSSYLFAYWESHVDKTLFRHSSTADIRRLMKKYNRKRFCVHVRIDKAMLSSSNERKQFSFLFHFTLFVFRQI